MNLPIPTDNRAGITYGGARDSYTLDCLYISRISSGASSAADYQQEATLANSISAASNKDWKFPTDVEVGQALIEAAGGSEIVAKLLVKRGIRTPEAVRSFLDPALYTPSAPTELPDIKRAVARVLQAVEIKEKITIYGDYDVDGVTATALMVSTLRDLGAEVDYYIPTRAEGYGLNLKAVSVLASKHRTKLIISCDCGISNFSEINFARSLGVETIVVDHHTMPELLPPAAAILHPKQLNEEHPLYHLPGVGVAYKLAEALYLELDRADEIPKLLDYVTLGMIADMVPLQQECRYLVQIGMPWLVKSERAGIKALLQQVGGRGESTDLVGFGLAPRINAVGRLSDANLAVKLMITADADEAEALAKQLELENARRQELCEEIFHKADIVASQNVRAGHRAIAIYDAGWHHGVVGIVASRLVEKYHCPVFIGELDPAEGIVKGSARGIPGIDLYEVLKANEQLALKWGGHKMAAGFSVEAAKADLFCKGLVETCNRMLAEQSSRPTLEIDLELPAEEIGDELANTIAKVAPFGMGNKKPVIAVRKQVCSSTRVLGREGKHHRIVVDTEDGRQLECVLWNSRGRVPNNGDVIDIAFSPEINVYQGVSRLQLVLNDWRDPNAIDFAPPAQQAPAPAQQIFTNSSAKPVSTTPAETISKLAQAASGTSDGVRIEKAPASKSGSADVLTKQLASTTWKDLRNHASPDSLLLAAVRKLGDGVKVFAEGSQKVEGVEFADRTTISTTNHLVLWNYPPSLQLFKSILEKTGATNVYLVGGAKQDADDAASFLRRLTGIVRYAINQREGQAEPEKIAAALGTSKMNLALGLTILKKINLIDWFAEDGLLYLDFLGEASEKPEQLGEYRQLANGLKDVVDFRRWCHQATLKELQLAFVPAAEPSVPAINADVPAQADQSFSGIQQHDTANQLSPDF